ncbi:MAG TPA: RNA polymerase sigma factor [Vicinamibacterales bacterium]|jgi:RNA polymerase sigma-70 factor (ECF subfamily)|nr:RNA polymerase sigma factor [Vicinamibacterales bacterium]
MTRDLTLSDVARATASGLSRAFLQDAGETDETLTMDEPTFRAFYERTARPLWAYLSRMTGDPHAADDLLQETYYRFLRADRAFASDAHRRHYLFRIAINLVRGSARVARPVHGAAAGSTREPSTTPADPAVRTDVSRAMGRLRPRERALLWLAYAEGSSHREIAGMLGVKAASVKMLLFRARRKLAALLGNGVSRVQD